MWEHLGQQLMVSQKVEINYEVAYLLFISVQYLILMNPLYEYFQLVAMESLYICAKIVMLLQKGFEPILGLVAPPPARASIHTLMNKYPIFWKSTTLGCIEV